MAFRTRVRVNNMEIYRWSQASARRLATDVADEVLRRARTILLVGPYTKGNLVRGLHVEWLNTSRGIDLRIGIDGTKYPYAKAVERGAVAHVIFPRPPLTRLRFYWRKVGQVVYPEMVNHPGQEGKAYLRLPLLIAGTRHGMRIVIRDL